MIIHIIKKVSRPNNPQWYAWSGILKNFIHKANSKKPKITLTEFNHPPDWGRLSSHVGKIANNENGTANAIENPSITIMIIILWDKLNNIISINEKTKAI